MTEEMRLLASVFFTILLAEMGDKTQLATMLFSADGRVGRWSVFLAASLALVAATAIGVVGGAWVARYVPPQTLQAVAGIGFMLIGAWTLWAARGA